MSRAIELARVLRAWDSGDITDETAASEILAIADNPDVAEVATPEDARKHAVASWQLKHGLTWMRQVIYPVGGITPMWSEWHLYVGRFDTVGIDGAVRFLPTCGRRASTAQPRIQSPSSRVEFAASPDSREAICAKCLAIAGQNTVSCWPWGER